MNVQHHAHSALRSAGVVLLRVCWCLRGVVCGVHTHEKKSENQNNWLLFWGLGARGEAYITAKAKKMPIAPDSPGLSPAEYSHHHREANILAPAQANHTRKLQIGF